MDDRELAELAALPAILDYLISKRQPIHDNTSDPRGARYLKTPTISPRDLAPYIAAISATDRSD